jgi:hypothetical protein
MLAGFSCEEVPILMEEFDEREFLFRIIIVAYVRNLGRFIHGQRTDLAECVLQLDGHLGVLASGMTGSNGDSAKACFSSWSSTDAISLSAISQLSLSQSKAPLMSA